MRRAMIRSCCPTAASSPRCARPASIPRGYPRPSRTSRRGRGWRHGVARFRHDRSGGLALPASRDHGGRDRGLAQSPGSEGGAIMRTGSKTPGLRIVGGTAYRSTPTSASFNRPCPAPLSEDRSSDDTPSTETARNGKLRNKRRDIWWSAEAATRYWRVRLEFDRAVQAAQRLELPEGSNHPVVDRSKDRQLVQCWREALVKQLLTPAWDVASIKWKQMALARGQHRYVDVNPERIERAIADDLEFLAAIRYGNRSADQRRPKMILAATAAS
jgi:hypothetical protein